MTVTHTPSTASLAHVDHALVVGASGAAGAAIASQLLRQGLRVTLAGRGAKAPHLAAYPELAQLPWRQVDALQPQTLRHAARDCDVIVHAASPSSYVDWQRTVLPMAEAVINAVAHRDVTVVLPGNVYGLLPGSTPQAETAAAAPALTDKGRMRQALEQHWQAAAQADRCRVLVVRAGDFFGAHAPNSWWVHGVVPALRRANWRAAVDAREPQKLPHVRRIGQPGVPGVGHLWTYLPDFARTVGLLLEQRLQLPRHAVFHTASHWDADGQTLIRHTADALAQATGHRPRVTPFPWWALRVAAPFHAMSRELLDMRYLWQQPLRLSNDALVRQLGHAEPHTPWEQAVRVSLGLRPPFVQAAEVADSAGHRLA